MPDNRENKPKLLLHICCAGCGAYVTQILRSDFAVGLYFYNPNIYPSQEFDIRSREVEKIVKEYNVKLFKEGYGHEAWLRKVRGRENDKERSGRCFICYYDRLRRTAQKAERKDFDYFATTLTISPHKNASVISAFGKKLAAEYGVRYLDRDFKKQDGFKKSARLSRELGFYRQDYCGCEFSRK